MLPRTDGVSVASRSDLAAITRELAVMQRWVADVIERERLPLDHCLTHAAMSLASARRSLGRLEIIKGPRLADVIGESGPDT